MMTECELKLEAVVNWQELILQAKQNTNGGNYSMTELKKCPFFGGSGKHYYFEDLGHLVICSNTICSSNKFGYTDADEAKQAWNRRANSE